MIIAAYIFEKKVRRKLSPQKDQNDAEQHNPHLYIFPNNLYVHSAMSCI